MGLVLLKYYGGWQQKKKKEKKRKKKETEKKCDRHLNYQNCGKYRDMIKVYC